MQKIVLVALILAGLQFEANAQINVQAVNYMMNEVGTSIERIESLRITNIDSYVSIGKKFTGYEIKDREYEKQVREFVVCDYGIGYKLYKKGKLISMKLYPYPSIKTITVLADSIEIEMKN